MERRAYNIKHMLSRFVPRSTFHVLRQNGYTLTELLVTIGVMSILLGIGTISFSTIRVRNQVDLVAAQVRTELLRVQSQAINGIESGVYFEANRYVYFPSATYTEGASDNEQTTFPSNISITSITLSGNTATFDSIAGYLEGFSDPAQVVITGQGNSHTVSINQWGTIEILQ